jgi:hypothetical protein
MKEAIVRPVLTPRLAGHSMEIFDYLNESRSRVVCECGYSQDVTRGDAHEIATAVARSHLADSEAEAEASG